MKTYICKICDWVYDEIQGDPDSGIPPGTKWDDVDEFWVCPDCGMGKNRFDMVELTV